MAHTKKARSPRAGRPVPSSNGGVSPGDILTLSEAADYLRISQEAVLRLIDEQALPARHIGAEWRLLKSAVQAWLGAESSDECLKRAQLALVGAWRNDPLVEKELQEIYQRRRTSRNEGVS